MTRFIKTRQDKKKSSQKENLSRKYTKNGTKIKCLVCGENAVGGFSIDIDIASIPYCKKHDFDIQMYLLMLVGGKKEDAESWLLFAQNHSNNVKQKRNTK